MRFLFVDDLKGQPSLQSYNLEKSIINLNLSVPYLARIILVWTFVCAVTINTQASVRFEHIAINVENPRIVADWYVKYLGLQIISQSERMIFVGGLDHHCMFEFYWRPDAGDRFGNLSHNASHVSFATDVVEELAKSMTGGGAIILKRFISPAGDTVINMKDPWGNNLQVIQRVEPKF